MTRDAERFCLSGVRNHFAVFNYYLNSQTSANPQYAGVSCKQRIAEQNR